MTTIFQPSSATIALRADHSWPASSHRFDVASVWAVQAALAARRPLLIRGEPGIGKSQVARAVAQIMGVPLLCQVVHERCEVGDLLYSVDSVSRLAQAQLAGAAGKSAKSWKTDIAEKRFIKPGVLWWALNWSSAARQAGEFFRNLQAPETPPKWTAASGGCVVLIDEIDKADTSVPNALLETLGNLGFSVSETGEFVRPEPSANPPLVIITTNEERELPAAFIRRCLVLQMTFPPEKMSPEQFLDERARAHFSPDEISPEVCAKAIGQLLEDRAKAVERRMAPPGVAELLDVLRALAELEPRNPTGQLAALEKISGFAFCKNPDAESM